MDAHLSAAQRLDLEQKMKKRESNRRYLDRIRRDPVKYQEYLAKERLRKRVKPTTEKSPSLFTCSRDDEQCWGNMKDFCRHVCVCLKPNHMCVLFVYVLQICDEITTHIQALQILNSFILGEPTAWFYLKYCRKYGPVVHATSKSKIILILV
jgi:hypothetical protein